MKKYFSILPYLALALFLLAGSCRNGQVKTAMNSQPQRSPEYDLVTDLGTIRIKLYAETPQHRDNFEKLAAEHFFDSILFHRVIPGFMIQTGDPLTKDTSLVEYYGTGGPGYTVPAEFVPGLTHKKGALAAARKGDFANPSRASSGSQFYIVQDEMGCRHLDGQYTVFGETVSGLEVIDRIAAQPTDPRDRPLKDIRILRVEKVVPAEAASAADSVKMASDSTGLSGAAPAAAGPAEEK